MRSVVWSEEALDDFDSAMFFIAQDSRSAASLVADRIESSIGSLAQMPVGRAGRVSGTYEWVIRKTPYILVYSLSETSVRILRIIHGARDWPEGEWPAE